MVQMQEVPAGAAVPSGGDPRPGMLDGTEPAAQLRAAAREAIRLRIASGRLRPGDRLNEAALSAELGVSRSPVREALRELEQHGLVVSYPNRGCFVADLTDRDVEEVVLLRGWLEGLAARLAAD